MDPVGYAMLGLAFALAIAFAIWGGRIVPFYGVMPPTPAGCMQPAHA